MRGDIICRMQTTRRQFIAGAAGGAAAAARLRAQNSQLTAQQVIDRIRTALGPQRPGSTVDRFQAGDPATIVTAVATTSMATVTALRTAVHDLRANLVITHEPVFYTATDDPGPRATDPVYLSKKQLIEDGKLVVYRLYDHWLFKFPNAFSEAIARHLLGRPVAGADQVYDIPETTLATLLSKTGHPGARLVGDPAMKVRRVFVAAGTTTLAATMAGLQKADVVIAGEPREWEAVPYVRDAITAGQAKGMISLGRIVSENQGMTNCAEWIQARLPQLTVKNILTPDPYWKAGA